MLLVDTDFKPLNPKKMLDNKTKERIAQEAEGKYPYVWPKNKHGEEIVMRVGQKAPPFSAKIRKMKQAYIAGAEAEATRAAGLIEAYRELCKLKDEMLNNMKNKATNHYELIGEEVAREYKLLKRIEALTNYNYLK